MSASNWVHVDFDEIVRETAAALLVRIDDEEIWIPKSQVADAGNYSEGDKDGTISIAEWLARDKGLE